MVIECLCNYADSMDRRTYFDWTIRSHREYPNHSRYHHHRSASALDFYWGKMIFSSNDYSIQIQKMNAAIFIIRILIILVSSCCSCLSACLAVINWVFVLFLQANSRIIMVSLVASTFVEESKSVLSYRYRLFFQWRYYYSQWNYS